jgi:hypothetical protein
LELDDLAVIDRLDLGKLNKDVQALKGCIMGIIKTDPLFQQIVERIPLELRESFTQEQLEALQGAIAHLSWRRHVIDIRLSLLGIYLVVVGGQERRSNKRLRMEKQDHPIWTAPNVLVFLVILAILLFALIGVLFVLVQVGHGLMN